MQTKLSADDFVIGAIQTVGVAPFLDDRKIDFMMFATKSLL